MSKRLREKIALVVFVGLVAFAGCCLGGYLVAGHSWNVAASSIDDTFGSMDGYVVIVYDGTAVSQAKSTASGSSAASASGSASDASSSLDSESTLADAADAPSDSSSSSAVAGELLEGEAAAVESGVGATAAADASEGESTDTAASATGATAEEDSAGADVAGSGAALGLSDAETASDGAQSASSATSSSAGASSSSTKDPVTADEVRASYEEKNAEVLVLDSANSGKYRDGSILKKGGHRFGVFSVDEDTTAAQIKQQVAYFEEHEVDFIVALTSDKELLEDASTGIDIVISTQDEGLFAMGETQDGTFFVDAPEIGSVGAILISPSNVVSAKVVNEL